MRNSVLRKRPTSYKRPTTVRPHPPRQYYLPCTSSRQKLIKNITVDNSEVFPEYIHHQLSPTAFVQPLPLKTVALIPPAMNHILVSVALRHRMYRVGANSGRRDRAVLEMRSKYYHHRGLAISAMDSDIRGGVTNVFVLMASAIMFVFAEVCGSSVGTLSARGGWEGG